MNFGEISAAHLIFIPATLVIGIVIGWVLGSRAAADAYAAQRKRDARRGMGGEGTKIKDET